MQDLRNIPLALRREAIPLALELSAASGELAGQAAALVDLEASSGRAGYDVLAGVAVIGVRGVLYQCLGTLRPWGVGPWAATGYDGIRANVDAALADAAVRAIVFLVDSPGGVVAGCFDLVDHIFAQRGKKPMVAICSENACSAAYAIASAADMIALPRTGCVGSIGVVAAHVDISGALEADGVKVTFLQYGARKTDGSPLKPLDDDARARMQADIDAMGELFVAAVARNRDLPAAAVRATQAATYLGELGVAAGLADVVRDPLDAFRELVDALG